jgi:hypothetical protein
MNQLTNRQQQALAAGLSAFTAAAHHRRARRVIARGAAVAVLLVAAVLAIGRLASPQPPRLPAYVEVIEGDHQLMGELQLASACERIERTDGRLRVVECVAMIPTR